MNISLKELPVEDLPRERLIRLGAQNLSNEELLAILLRTGTKNISVKSLALQLLSKVESITELKDLSFQNISSIKGMGIAKSTNILAALELGRRVYEERIPVKAMPIKNSLEAYRHFGKEIENSTQENFLVIYMDNQHRYISSKIIFKGTINQSIVHPREVFKEALRENSNSIIVMHNHPSGVLTPSKADDKVTMQLVEAGNMIGVQLIDHLIVGRGNYYSYIEEGRLRYE